MVRLDRTKTVLIKRIRRYGDDDDMFVPTDPFENDEAFDDVVKFIPAVCGETPQRG